VSADRAFPDRLTALCGEEVYPGQAEMLDRICGMPCQTCLLRSPAPAAGFLAAAG
jgi:hypothetical protein